MKSAMLFLVLSPGVAVGFLLVLAILLRWSLVPSPSERKRCEYLLLVTIFSALLSSFAQAIANRLSVLCPLKYDLYLYRMDALLDEPSFALGRLVAPHLWLQLVLQAAYGLLPVAVTSLLGVYIWKREAEWVTVLKTLLLNLLLAPVFYMLLPVCGPVYAFPTFPQAQSLVVPHLIALSAAPNGMPSIHTSTALLLLWFGRHWLLGRWLGCLYLVLIIAATLAGGQHYLMDLLAAVPYAAAMGWVGSYSRKAVVTYAAAV
jgi:hypothetical protein